MRRKEMAETMRAMMTEAITPWPRDEMPAGAEAMRGVASGPSFVREGMLNSTVEGSGMLSPPPPVLTSPRE